MFKPLEIFIGLRYTRAKRRNHFISFISLISMAGIAVGVFALVVVISVMNGFETELRERILGMVAHATVSEVGDSMSDWQAAIDQAKGHPRIVGAAPYIEQETMLKGRRVSGARVRGVSPSHEPSVSEINQQLIVGSLDDLQAGAFNIVLGVELAYALGVEVGGKVTVFSPQLRSSVAGILPTVKRFNVIGLFEAGMNEYDRSLAIMNIDDASKMFRIQGVTGVRLKIDDMFLAWRVARELADSMDGRFIVSDWTQQHANFFRAVRTEKTVMFAILFLIVAVAAFNIVSTLVMVVTDKQADIAILRTLGISPHSVMAIFIVQGVLIGFFGTLLGLVTAIPVALNVESIVPFLEHIMGVDFLDAGVYYISDLPSDMRWVDVMSIAVGSFFVSLLATLYPAWRASQTRPAEALRYE